MRRVWKHWGTRGDRGARGECASFPPRLRGLHGRGRRIASGGRFPANSKRLQINPEGEQLGGRFEFVGAWLLGESLPRRFTEPRTARQSLAHRRWADRRSVSPHTFRGMGVLPIPIA